MTYAVSFWGCLGLGFIITGIGNQEVAFLRNHRGQVTKMPKPERSGEMETATIG